MLLGPSLPLAETFALFFRHLFFVSFLPFLFPFVASLYHPVFDPLSFFSFSVDLQSPWDFFSFFGLLDLERLLLFLFSLCFFFLAFSSCSLSLISSFLSAVRRVWKQ